MDGHSLTRTALRVLNACTEHQTPQPADVEVLTRHAILSEEGLPIDELASEILRRELARKNASTGTNS
jgi:hypothetical protein